MKHARWQPLLGGALFLVLAEPAWGQSVHVVAGDGSGDFVQVQDAVTAAANSDVILVRAHTERYEATVIDGKSLTLVGEGAVRPRVEDVRVMNLTAGRDVSLRFLDIEGRSEPDIFFGGLQRPGVELVSDDGCVWLEDLVVAGGDGMAKLGGFETGFPGLVVENSDCVVVVDSSFDGGTGYWSVGGSSDPGGDGGELMGSRVALHGATFVGGAGGLGVAGVPGQGGAGLDSSSSTVFASDSSLTGGDTGDVSALPPQDPSSSGLVARDGSTVKHLATTFAEGGGPAAPGAPLSVEGGSSAEDLSDEHRALEVSRVVREGEEAHVTYSGEPGDLVLLRYSLGSDWTFVTSLKGVQHLGAGTLDVMLGAAGASGTMDVVFRAPELPVGVLGLVGHVQPLVAAGDGAKRLGAPSSTVIVDASIPGP